MLQLASTWQRNHDTRPIGPPTVQGSVCALSTGWPWAQAFGSQYNIILQRKDTATVLLGEVLHFGATLPAIPSPLAALQRVFLGQYVPLEVFRVNMTALSPQQLCGYLTHVNPGVGH